MWFHGTIESGDPDSLHLFGEMSHRLFGDRKTLTPLGEAHQFLKQISRWNGATHRHQSARGIWWEYEIPRNKLPAATGVLTLLLGSHMLRKDALSPIKDPIETLVRELMQEVIG